METKPKFRLHFFNDAGMPEQIRKNLYWVIWSVTVGMIGFVVTTGPVWSAFQREILGANDFQIGLISAIPIGTCALQVFISYYIEKKRNRRVILVFLGLAGRSLWLLIALVPYIFPGFSPDLRIWIVIVFVVFISTSNSGVNLSFGSLIADLVPIRIRGSYFSARQRISLISGVTTGLLLSLMIDRVGLIGYSIALGIAGIAMLLDIVGFLFVKWPEMEEAHLPSLGKLLKEVFSNKQFLKVVVFYSAWLFSVNIAGPFWNIHMLEYLKMSFIQMTLYTQVISGASTILFIAHWGKLIDRYGNKPILQIAAICIVFSPIPWLFATRSTIAFVLISNVISGAAWPVIDICQQNLYLLQSPRTHRSMYIAVFFACINLCGIALSNAIGGYLMQTPFAYLADHVPVVLGLNFSKMHWMILTSIILRVLVLVLFLPRIREDGAQTLSVTMKGIARNSSEQVQRRVSAIRTNVSRKPVRQTMQSDTGRMSGKGK